MLIEKENIKEKEAKNVGRLWWLSVKTKKTAWGEAKKSSAATETK